MKILVVDDDRVLAELIAFAFQREGYEAIQAHDGETALARWSAENPALLILDVNLPKVDGFTVCRRIRARADTPIILLTVRDDEDDIVHGLEIGADDYMSKPFSPRQLVARAQAVLRRVESMPPRAVRQIGDLILDPARREVRLATGRTVTLTPLENRLLDYLAIHPGQILPTETIIDHVWGPDGASHDMVRQLIHRLRGKIEPDPARPRYVETVSGVGYGLTRLHPPV
jgi:DNA-binding response OmpR family regulator